MATAFADISLWQLALIAGCTVLASVIGGVAGYGTGALMPLVLVPIVGPEPVVPIIAISALFTNSSRVAAFYRALDWRRAAIVLVASIPTCVLGAWGYTRLTGTGALVVIGSMMVLSVPLRRLLSGAAFSLAIKVSRSLRPAGAWWSAALPARASSCCRC